MGECGGVDLNKAATLPLAVIRLNQAKVKFLEVLDTHCEGNTANISYISIHSPHAIHAA